MPDRQFPEGCKYTLSESVFECQRHDDETAKGNALGTSIELVAPSDHTLVAITTSWYPTLLHLPHHDPYWIGSTISNPYFA